MARMSREFSLVLLGAGLLTAGSFFWPEEDLESRADAAVQQQVASSTPRRHPSGTLIFLHTSTYRGPSTSSPVRAGGIMRSGFGGTGASVSSVS
jgi:hypothetical protein